MTKRECEDCEEPIPEGWRRWRCPRCGLLVCGWCEHHVHKLEIYLDKQRRAKAALAKE